eukprot:763418-Hanusia_phi.AAC.15
MVRHQGCETRHDRSAGELTTTGNCAALVTVTGARFDVFSRYSCSLLLQDGSNISSSFEQPTSPSTIYFKVDIANSEIESFEKSDLVLTSAQMRRLSMISSSGKKISPPTSLASRLPTCLRNFS